MNKRGWNTPVGLLVIVIITLSIFSAFTSVLGPELTGNIVRLTGSEEVTLHYRETITFNGVLIKFSRIISNNAAEIFVEDEQKTIYLNEITNINGIQFKLTEINDQAGESLDSFTILISDLAIEKIEFPSSTGRFELAYGQRTYINGNTLFVMPAENSAVRIFFNDVNRLIQLKETAKIQDYLITFEEIKDFPGEDFDRVKLSLKLKSKEEFSVIGNQVNFAVNDPVDIEGKTVMLLRTDNIRDGRATFSVDGRIDTIEKNTDKIVNDMNIKVINIEDSIDDEFDRAAAIVRRQI